uniref:Major Facilitator Superfamily protein n=1 Tax=Candidatus Kentrum sp. TC TaxID=2126339 RepID=A0A450YB37_9GAMM|nr:MAG: Major Facilitator Superfamily protein [Candidatus Kentron sp. TC]
MNDDLKSARKDPMYGYLLLLAVAAAIGFQGWLILFNNFAADEVELNGFHIGVVQSVREIPGFLSLLVVFLLFFVKEHRLAAISILFLGGGIFITGIFPSFLGLIATTLLMSLGFHYFETTNQSLTLQYFSEKQSPHVFARIRSLSAVTNIIVGVAIFFLAKAFSFETNYGLLGGIIVACGMYALTRNPTNKALPAQRKEMVFRKKYWLFYVLNFLSGARRQIFVVFAVFMLVEKYHYSVEEIAILFVINNVIAYFFNPYIARGINLFGEKKMLSLEYSGLFLIFLAYVFIENRWVVAVLYILDHLLFNFAIGIRTYFQKHADPRDIAPSMAVGFTINHIAAVVIPVFGGILWMVDWRIPFIAGAVLSLISLGFVGMMKGQGQRDA